MTYNEWMSKTEKKRQAATATHHRKKISTNFSTPAHKIQSQKFHIGTHTHNMGKLFEFLIFFSSVALPLSPFPPQRFYVAAIFYLDFSTGTNTCTYKRSHAAWFAHLTPNGNPAVAVVLYIIIFFYSLSLGLFVHDSLCVCARKIQYTILNPIATEQFRTE